MMTHIQTTRRAVAALFRCWGLTCLGVGSIAAQESSGVDLTRLRSDVPQFSAYEVEYTSAFGRFFNQIRPFDANGTPKISVLNIIATPGGVIVDTKVLDRATLRLEYTASPYFAWGQEYIVGRSTAEEFEWTRVPLAGGAPMQTSGRITHGGVIDDLGFSPTLAAFMPLPMGARVRLPALQPQVGGTLAEVLLDYEVVARDSLVLASGVSCLCWVIEYTDERGARHRTWVSREAPFVYRRHRDIGGPRDFISDVLSFRMY